MLHKLKEKYNRQKDIFINCTWLYLLQLVNYIFPLIIIPYLFRTIGSQSYGVVVMTQAIATYSTVFLDYGFNFTSTRIIAKNSNDLKKIEEEISYVFWIKTILFCLILCCFLFAFVFNPFSIDNATQYFCGIFIVAGQGFLPIYFFQGISSMKIIAIINFISKGLYLLLLFLCIKDSQDVYLVILSQGLSGCFVCIIAYVMIIKKYHITISRHISFRKIKQYLKDGGSILIANLSGNVCSQGSVLITGALSSTSAAAYFSIGQKISVVIISLIQPFTQAIYPKLCIMLDKDYENKKIKLRKMVLTLFAIDIIIFILLNVFTQTISVFLQGNRNLLLEKIIHIYSMSIAFSFINTLLHPVYLALGWFDQIKRVYFLATVFFLLIAVPFTFYSEAIGMTVSIVLVDLYIFISYIKLFFNFTNKSEVY